MSSYAAQAVQAFHGPWRVELFWSRMRGGRPASAAPPHPLHRRPHLTEINRNLQDWNIRKVML